MIKKWLILLILFLLAANTALVTTLIFMNKANVTGRHEIRDYNNFRSHKNQHLNFDEHLSHELGFNHEQRELVRKFSDEFHQRQRANMHELHSIRKRNFEELAQKNPDTIFINELCKKLGEIESAKIKLEYEHYRNIRSVCNAEQAIKMDSLGRMHMQKHYMKKGSENRRRHKNPERYKKIN